MCRELPAYIDDACSPPFVAIIDDVGVETASGFSRSEMMELHICIEGCLFVQIRNLSKRTLALGVACCLRMGGWGWGSTNKQDGEWLLSYLAADRSASLRRWLIVADSCAWYVLSSFPDFPRARQGDLDKRLVLG